MKTRVAVRTLITNYMNDLSKHEEQLKETLKFYNDKKIEFKRTNDPRVSLCNFAIKNAEGDLERVTKRKSEVNEKTMVAFQEMAIGGESELEIDDDFVTRMLEEGTG